MGLGYGSDAGVFLCESFLIRPCQRAYFGGKIDEDP